MASLNYSNKQKIYINEANSRWNFKVGAVRSGKSYVDISFTILNRIRTLKDCKGLNVILGVSKETIERNVLQPMREIYTSALVGTINSRNIAMIAGLEVYCLGAEKASQVAKVQGSSIKYCYGDEVAKWNKEVFEMLKSRLDKPYSCFDGACNPESPNHWLKEFLDRDDINAYIQHYRIFDNPFLSADFVEDLCNEYQGTVYYDRYIEGNWTNAEGLIYPMFGKAIEDAPQDIPTSEYCLSIDYGTQNAFACLLWEKKGVVWYATREYYYSGRDTGLQKTDEEYMIDIEDFIKDIKYGDRIETIIDPSAASFIALLRRRGKFRVRPADNDVADGIRETATCMNKGWIKFGTDLKEWKKEVQGYIWDDKSVEDRPIKEADHLQDSCRYFVKTKRLVRQNSKREYNDNENTYNPFL